MLRTRIISASATNPSITQIKISIIQSILSQTAVSFLIFLAYPILIAKRIIHEEAFLEKELEGYRDYKRSVKYRLIPFVW